MKNRHSLFVRFLTFIICGAAFLESAYASVNIAGELKDPLKKYTVALNDNVTISDIQTGKPVCVIVEGIKDIQATFTPTWSKDSKKLILIEQFGRTANIFVAKIGDGGRWTSERLDLSDAITKFYNTAGIMNKVMIQKYAFGKWLSDNEFTINATALTSERIPNSKPSEVSFEFPIKISEGQASIGEPHAISSK